MKIKTSRILLCVIFVTFLFCGTGCKKKGFDFRLPFGLPWSVLGDYSLSPHDASEDDLNTWKQPVWDEPSGRVPTPTERGKTCTNGDVSRMMPTPDWYHILFR